jgi:hypothetical protein
MCDERSCSQDDVERKSDFDLMDGELKGSNG